MGPGADLGFSLEGGGGADFQKEIENFDDLFFLGRQIDIFYSPKALFCPYFVKIFSAAEKSVKKGVFRHFLENFDSPLKISKYWRPRRL